MRTSKKTVVLLCGDERLCAIYKRLCEKNNVSVKTVRNVEKTLLLIKEKKPTALIVDRASVKEDVFVLLEEMHRWETLKKIPVFVLSHVSDREDIARARSLSVYAYVISAHSHPELVVQRIVTEL